MIRNISQKTPTDAHQTPTSNDPQRTLVGLDPRWFTTALARKSGRKEANASFRPCSVCINAGSNASYLNVPVTTPPPSYASITQNIQIGASGQNVIALQAFLIAKGFLTMPTGVAEGYFGNLTKQALIAYQSSVGLPDTGYCGPMTRAIINNP